MITLIACALIIGVFVAGHYFALHTIGALALLAFAVIGLGVLIAAAETRGFEGCSAPTVATDTAWGGLAAALFRLNEASNRFFSNDPVYVQTASGPLPVASLFYARVNGVRAIVLDTEPDDAMQTFNALKQGVM